MAKDAHDVTEVRTAILDVLAVGAPGGDDLLAWLRSEERREQRHGFADAMLAARARQRPRARTCAARTTHERFGGSAGRVFGRRRDGEEGAGRFALQDRASLSY
jgi:hypothetical protein